MLPNGHNVQGHVRPRSPEVIVLSDDEAPEPPRRPPASNERRTLREPDNRGREQEMPRDNNRPNGTANTNGIAPRSDREVRESKREGNPERVPQLPNRPSDSRHPQNDLSYQAAMPQLHQAPPHGHYFPGQIYGAPTQAYAGKSQNWDFYIKNRATNFHHATETIRSLENTNRELSWANYVLERKVEEHETRLRNLEQTLRTGLDEHYDRRWEHAPHRSQRRWGGVYTSHGRHDDFNAERYQGRYDGQGYGGRIQERDEDFRDSTASNRYRERSSSRESTQPRRNDYNAERHQGQYERGQGPSTSRDY